MNLILLGAPGCGKGTQAGRIAEKFNWAHISSGDIFRHNIADKTEIGVKAKAYIDRGELVPDELTVQMVLDRLTQKDCANGFVLDGFPRNVYQAQELEKVCKITAVIDIDVNEDLLMDRITGRRSCVECGEPYHISSHKGNLCDKCGGELVHRKDDKPETVKTRLEVYHRATEKLVKYYDDCGLLFTVDGNGSPDDVFNGIKYILEDLQ